MLHSLSFLRITQTRYGEHATQCSAESITEHEIRQHIQRKSTNFLQNSKVNMHYFSHTNNEKLLGVFLGTFHHHIQTGSCGLLSKELEIKWLQHKTNHPIVPLHAIMAWCLGIHLSLLLLFFQTPVCELNRVNHAL